MGKCNTSAAPDQAQDVFRKNDSSFVALIDGAFADAAGRSGSHLLCRPGCTQCCIGVFAIGPADVLRLEEGLTRLELDDPQRAARVRDRASASWAHLAPEFPGDRESGLLYADPDGQPVEAFEDFANREPCPALDPESGTCDLYASRPQTCRVFGPPVMTDEGYGVCELCFQRAAPAEIASAAIHLPDDQISTSLDEKAVHAGARQGSTIVAFVLATHGSNSE
jgi:Fe-S-cluster containining protein